LIGQIKQLKSGNRCHFRLLFQRYSGNKSFDDIAELRKGVSILTSSRENQTSDETMNGGLLRSGFALL
jgi:hypothetical protein